MADKPILLIPTPTSLERAPLDPGRGDDLKTPTKTAQRKRLEPKWKNLLAAFSKAQTTTDDIDPQQVVVLQVAGNIEGFQNAVLKMDGMEWLGDFQTEIEKPAPGFMLDGSAPSSLDSRIFVMASNQARAQELVHIWKMWLNVGKKKLSRKLAPYARVFKHLHDVRLWGPKDRIQTTGVVEYWEKELSSQSPLIRFEVELWCRAKPQMRQAAYSRLSSMIDSAGGRCIKRHTIEEIDYDGVLVELPAAAVRAVVKNLSAPKEKTVLRLVDVKYFAPIGQASVIHPADEANVAFPNRRVPDGDPVVAILDGLPLTNHTSLQGRLIVDDPDDLAKSYQDAERRHGTAMASLVAHGEYNANEQPLGSKIYVRPVMAPGHPDERGRRKEAFPANELTVDLIHRAVRRMFESEPNSPPRAPGVKVINLSVGDASQMFDRQLSPWARLLDWLACKYKVLFIVSTGNPGSQITIPVPPTSLSGLADEDLRSHSLRSMASQRVSRGLLAPAESINSLTVGALHAQAGPTGNAGTLIDPHRGGLLPSPAMTVASGFRRAVKPEILVPGGRLHLERPINQPNPLSTLLTVTNAPAQPGQLVATGDASGNSNSRTGRLCGSSNAAALTTRRAAQLIEQLRQLQAEPGGTSLTEDRFAVILKAMLVHGASWGDFEEFFYERFVPKSRGKQDWQKVKNECAQFLGYGAADFDRGTICTDQRVIVLGCGELKSEESHLYNVPLPQALNAVKVKRRLAVTLAWFTPIRPRHRNYRVAHLWFKVPVPSDTDKKKNLAFPSFFRSIERREVDGDATLRGTIQHEVVHGEDIVAVTDGDTMPIQVNCRPDAGPQTDEPVPYALVVSLETAQPLGASIYTQVKTKIDALRVSTPVRAASSSSRRST